MNRREFLLGSIAGVGAAGAPRRQVSANEKLVIGIMGVNSRGSDLAAGFTAVPGFEVAYICDVDERVIGKGLAAVAKHQTAVPKTVGDFRRILDDKSVDALVVAAPDFWHAPATILGCAAGKHVYCEKPACHNPHEGELMIQAARKHNRVVQLGTQRRSMPAIREAMGRIAAGELGHVGFIKAWYTADRKSIGKGHTASVPAGLNYELWQGPTPERPYRDNLIHYNWHWFWHWGTGELGNNGIHGLDVCRWGAGVEYPRRVTAGGGKIYFPADDDQETPDTLVTTYDCGDRMITWEGRSVQKQSVEGSMFGVGFYGEKGTLISDGGSYRILDLGGKEIANVKGSGSDSHHFRNFAECVRSGKRPNADVEECVKSTLMCHLGNIAWRTGRTLNIDPKTGHILGDREAQSLCRREYRPGWEPRV